MQEPILSVNWLDNEFLKEPIILHLTWEEREKFNALPPKSRKKVTVFDYKQDKNFVVSRAPCDLPHCFCAARIITKK